MLHYIWRYGLRCKRTYFKNSNEQLQQSGLLLTTSTCIISVSQTRQSLDSASMFHVDEAKGQVYHGNKCFDKSDYLAEDCEIQRESKKHARVREVMFRLLYRAISCFRGFEACEVSKVHSRSSVGE